MELTEVLLAGVCIFSFGSFTCAVLILGAVMSNQRVKKEEDAREKVSGNS